MFTGFLTVTTRLQEVMEIVSRNVSTHTTAKLKLVLTDYSLQIKQMRDMIIMTVKAVVYNTHHFHTHHTIQ